jgi:hypothetical protein
LIAVASIENRPFECDVNVDCRSLYEYAMRHMDKFGRKMRARAWWEGNEEQRSAPRPR